MLSKLKLREVVKTSELEEDPPWLRVGSYTRHNQSFEPDRVHVISLKIWEGTFIVCVHMKLTYFSDKLHKDSSFFSPVFHSERRVAIRRKGGRAA